MRIISQNKEADVGYEEGALKIEGPRIYFMNAVEKILLGTYPQILGDEDRTKKVLAEIAEAALNGEKIYNMPSLSYK